MQTSKMVNYSNITLLKEFREHYLLSQDELAALLGIERAQLSMSERLKRPLTKEAEKDFLALLQKIEATDCKLKETYDFDKDSRDRQINLCNSKLIDLQHTHCLLKKALDSGENKIEKLMYAIQFWDLMKENASEFKCSVYEGIRARLSVKLNKIDTSKEWLQDLEVKILSATIDVVRQFMDEKFHTPTA